MKEKGGREGERVKGREKGKGKGKREGDFLFENSIRKALKNRIGT